MLKKVLTSFTIVLYAVSHSGCAHTFIIEKNAPPERYREAENFLHDKTASVKLNTGGTLHATNMHIGPDSTVFRIDGATDRIVVMNERIRSIATQDIREGVEDGALAGAIGGGIVGLIIGGLIASIDYKVTCDSGPYEENDPWGSCKQPEENDAITVLAGLGTGVIGGGLLGALIGSQTGTMHCVEFYRDPKDPQRWEYLPR